MCDDDVAYFYPLHYEPGYAYPLLVWLEPDGPESGRLLGDVMPYVSLRNLAAVSVRAGVLAALAFEGLLVRAQRRLVFNPQRVWLAGFETMGTAALEHAARLGAAHLAGAVSLGGPFPAAWSRLLPDCFGNLPLFLAAWPELGPDAVTRIRDDARRAEEAGVPLTFVFHDQAAPGWIGALREAHAWIMRRVSA